MPSRPSLARTVRKEAGTETRPLVSIRLVNVDTNWSISPSRTRADAGTVFKAWGASPCPENWVGGAAQFPPWPLKERGQLLPPFTHRTGIGGIAWDNMGVNGHNRDGTGFPREKGAKQPYQSCFLVNRSQLPLHG